MISSSKDDNCLGNGKGVELGQVGDVQYWQKGNHSFSYRGREGFKDKDNCVKLEIGTNTDKVVKRENFEDKENERVESQKKKRKRGRRIRYIEYEFTGTKG